MGLKCWRELLFSICKEHIVTITLRVAGVCLFLISLAAFAENPYPFKAKLEKRADHIAAVAYNDGPASISAVVNVASSNCKVSTPANIRVVVKAHASVDIAQIRALSTGVGCQAGLNFKYQIGDFTRGAEDEPFRIPFEDGKAFTVGQAFGGPLTSHNSPEAQYALDINMPQGTKIVAAKDGIVVDYAFGYTNSGSVNAALNLKANFVLIEHADGVLTLYSHLAPIAVPLKLGEPVHAGELIGYSGTTGYSSGPHLHFAVLKPYFREDGTLVSRALPFKLYANSSNNSFVPRKGMLLAPHAVSVSRPRETAPVK